MKSKFIAILSVKIVLGSFSISAEAIESKNIEYFQSSTMTAHPQVVIATLKPAPASAQPIAKQAYLPKMPTPIRDVLPKTAPPKTNAGKNPPAGTLPVAIDPATGKIVVLLGYEQGNITGFTDFGGSGDPTDISREHTAVREFNEETCLAFWEDLSTASLNRATTSGSQLETMAQQPLTQNLIPLFYAAKNKYFTCLLPVRYQSIGDLNKSISTVRNKVNAHPFFEKTDFAWVPLESFVGWIESGIENPTIPRGKGKPISWRFLGGNLQDFKDLKTGKLGWLYDRVIQYLKDIVALNS